MPSISAERVVASSNSRFVKCSLVTSHFIASFCGLGVVYTFGAWIPSLLDEFGGSDAQTQVIMGVLLCGWSLGGILSKSLLARWGNFRLVYMLGGALVVTVLLIVSFAQSLTVTYMVFFAGVGLQMAWMVSAALLPRHLSQRDMARCSAIAVTGSGFGTMALASFARVAIPALGWRIALRLLVALIGILMSIGASCQVAPPPMPMGDSSGKGSYAALFCRQNFPLFIGAVCFGSAGYMNVFQVQGVHALNHGITAADFATIQTIFGVFSLVGRISVGGIAGCVNPLLIWGVAMYLVAGCVAIIACAKTFTVFAVGNALIGVCSGPMIALLLPALRELVHVAQVPEALVVVQVVQSAFVPFAPVVSGALADATGSYLPGLLLGVGFIMIGSVLVTVAICRQRNLQADTASAQVAAGDIVGKTSNLDVTSQST